MIKRKNLDNSLLQWIMTVTGLGPGIGELHWVAPATSATSQFKTQLTDDLGVSEKIHATIAAAENVAVAYRNDAVLVMPGNYLVTAELDWDKAYTHLIGLGGPVVTDYGDGVGAIMYTTTASLAQLLDVGAKGQRIVNMGFDNNGANAANVAGVRLSSAVAPYFKGCFITGNMNNTQSAAAACTSLLIHSGNMWINFEDCIFGNDGWSYRTGTYNSHIRFTGTSQNYGGLFKNCRILSLGNTAACVMVSVAITNSLGPSYVFDNCGFLHTTHLTGAQGTSLSSAFYFGSIDRDVEITLHNCYATNITEWTNQDLGNLLADMPLTATGGGLTKEPTGTVGA